MNSPTQSNICSKNQISMVIPKIKSENINNKKMKRVKSLKKWIKHPRQF